MMGVGGCSAAAMDSAVTSVFIIQKRRRVRFGNIAVNWDGPHEVTTAYAEKEICLKKHNMCSNQNKKILTRRFLPMTKHRRLLRMVLDALQYYIPLLWRSGLRRFRNLKEKAADGGDVVVVFVVIIVGGWI